MKNILSIFRDWDIDPRKISVWARDWSMQLNRPGIESPKQGNTVFEILTIFVKKKKKNFPKATKNLKIFLWLINRDSACENTFN